jgi:UDP-glucose 4-epimerase
VIAKRVTRVVVTGGSGLVGQYVMKELGTVFDVINADLVPLPGAVSVQTDVMRLDQVRAVLQGADAVVHLAALDLGVRASPEDYMRVNTLGTWHVLQVAAELRLLKAVVCSSVAATGLNEMRPDWIPRYLPIDEDHECRPTHAYGVSKLSVEMIALSFSRASTMDVVCIRPVVVLPEDAIDQHPGLVGDGGRRWLFSYVTAGDVARGIRLALQAPGPRYGLFFLSAADTASDEPTLQWYERSLGTLPEIVDPRSYEVNERASVFSCARAREVLGWEPTSDFRTIRRNGGYE